VQGQGELDLALDPAEIAGGPLEIIGSRPAHLWDALCRAYEVLGPDRAAGGAEVFRDLALARIIEPTNADSLRVLVEAGVEPVSYRTLTGTCRTSPRALSARRCRRRAPSMPGWASIAGALRREHLVFRDRYR
jgi:hypothetical protein